MIAWWENQQRKQYDRLQDPRWQHLWDTRLKRRRLAAAGGASLALLWTSIPVIWFTAPSDLAMYITMSLIAVALVIYFPVVSLLNVATKGAAATTMRLLDERQVAERLRANSIAHRLTTWVLGGLFLTAAIVSLSTDENTMVIPTAVVYPLAFTLWLTQYVLPLLISGWRLPDPPPEDD
jgi:hypothetical protein